MSLPKEDVKEIKHRKLYPTKDQHIVQFGNTLRLHPQNCLVAHFEKERGHWVCDPDLAVPLAYQLLVKAALSVHKIKWSHPDTHKLYNAVAYNKDTIAALDQLEIMELIMGGINHGE